MADSMTTDLSPFVVPQEIAKAIGEVMTQIKSLPKGERNQHGGYNFASIDDFLAAIGPLCASAGLIVYQDEGLVDTIDRGGKSWLKATYTFTLGHTSGVVWSKPVSRTVYQSITGPQTTGSCQSYALKQFLRSLFMIPTGDRDDADYHKPEDMPATRPAQQYSKPAEKPAPKRPTPSADASPGALPTIQVLRPDDDDPKWGTYHKALTAALKLCTIEKKPVAEIKAFWARHAEGIKEMHGYGDGKFKEYATDLKSSYFKEIAGAIRRQIESAEFASDVHGLMHDNASLIDQMKKAGGEHKEYAEALEEQYHEAVARLEAVE